MRYVLIVIASIIIFIIIYGALSHSDDISKNVHINKPRNTNNDDSIRHKVIKVKDKGELAEERVSDALQVIYGKKFNNYWFFDNKGTTHEIDHIILNSKGLFVIETKSLYGEVYGNSESHEWIQIINGEKKKIHSPIKQNNSHIYHLKHTLDIKVNIKSCIIMEQGNIKNIDSDEVFTIDSFINYMNSLPFELYPDEINEIHRKLLNHQANNVSKKMHVEKIHNRIKKLENNICPRCGAKLIKSNNYYICSNVYNCDFKKNI